MAAWVMPVLTGVLQVLEAITFIQFIEEEAIQTCGMGAFIACKYNNWKALEDCLDTLENELIPHLTTINESVGWIAIYSKGAFADYITASNRMVATYRELLSNAALKTPRPS